MTLSGFTSLDPKGEHFIEREEYKELKSRVRKMKGLKRAGQVRNRDEENG
jgi:hypothetical protein